MINKRLKLLFVILFAVLGLFTSYTVSAHAQTKIYFFYGTGCPHCAIVENYLNENDMFEKYSIDKREIYFNRENAVLFNNLMDKYNISANLRGVPTMIVGDKVITGDKPIIDNFVKEVDAYSLTPPNEPINLATQNVADTSKPDLTIVAVVGASVVDAINPCAFAVLIILMTTILVSGQANKALKAGLAFSASIFISYFLMGLGIYKAIEFGGISGLFFKLVGWIALVMGLLNLKDYFWYGKGVLMEVPLSWRPKMKSLIRSVSSPLGAFAVGFLVSLFLLPCTSGPYIVILGMLAQKAYFAKAIAYLVLYNFIFISPMVFISLAVYKGFDPNKAEEIRQKRLKSLHLIAGILMLLMGLAIIFGWL